jgi:hypothetical protein
MIFKIANRPMPRVTIQLLAVAVLALSGMFNSPETQAAGPEALCIYDGGSFSEGANICVQARLMMTCSVSGDRLVWTVVSDKEISRFCVTSFRRRHGSRLRVAMPRHDAARPPAVSNAAPAGSSDKCFSFNGKRYCE